MTTSDLLHRLADAPAIAIEPEELEGLLEAGEVVREADTGLTGPIRVIEVGDHLLVQERTQKGELALRGMPSRDTADRFVSDRLAAYERMWDG